MYPYDDTYLDNRLMMAVVSFLMAFLLLTIFFKCQPYLDQQDAVNLDHEELIDREKLMQS